MPIVYNRIVLYIDVEQPLKYSRKRKSVLPKNTAQEITVWNLMRNHVK